MRTRLSGFISGLMIGTLLLACSAPTSTPTPDLKNLQTRIAATIAAIPTAESLTPRVTATTASTASPSALPVPQDTATPPPILAAPEAGAVQEYTVAAGDTLSTIALKFNTSIAALQLANNLDNVRVVRLGQRLKIPTSKLAADENPYWIVHIVQPGETLSTIAVKYTVKLEDLLRVNNIAHANAALTRVGDKLIIPVTGPVA